MGSFLSFLSPTRKASWGKVQIDTPDLQHGRPFTEMIKNHTQYGTWIEARATYEVKLIHHSVLHWYLLIRRIDSSMLPYISMEVTTPDMNELISVTRNFESYDANQASDLGTYEGTLYYLCQLADRVVNEMKTYNLLCRNCQTFCNKLLNKMGKNEFPTSLESELIDREFDLLNEILPRNPVPTGVTVVQGEEIVVKSIEMSEIDLFSPPEIGDLKTIHEILVPVLHNWMDIGNKLAVQNLDAIRSIHGGIANQCLREMLREYLQRSDPSPSWVELAEAVKEYSDPVAKSIRKKARKIRTN